MLTILLTIAVVVLVGLVVALVHRMYADRADWEKSYDEMENRLSRANVKARYEEEQRIIAETESRDLQNATIEEFHRLSSELDDAYSNLEMVLNEPSAIDYDKWIEHNHKFDPTFLQNTVLPFTPMDAMNVDDLVDGPGLKKFARLTEVIVPDKENYIPIDAPNPPSNIIPLHPTT